MGLISNFFSSLAKTSSDSQSIVSSEPAETGDHYSAVERAFQGMPLDELDYQNLQHTAPHQDTEYEVHHG